MRLRNLFMILLLCMTVGMFGVSCTGDDGAQGPKGDTGEQGPPGDDGADAGDSMEHYGFLKMWGSKTGDIACTDPLLNTPAAFPRTEPLDSIATGGTNELEPPNGADHLNAPITVVCGAELFGQAVVKGEGNVNVVGNANLPSNGLIFVKTGRATAASETASTPQNDIDPATRTTTSKKFVGGYVVATQNTTGGSEEPLDRRDLYRDCQKGTPPPAIRGDWQGVQIIEETKGYRDGEPEDLVVTSDSDASVDPITVTTTKVCVRLDSHPGVVKCFIDKNHSSDPTKESKDIALYDAEKGATSLMTLVNLNNSPTDPTGTLSDAVDNETDDAQTGAAGNQKLFSSGTDDFSHEHVEQLCNLFEEGLK